MNLPRTLLQAFLVSGLILVAACESEEPEEETQAPPVEEITEAPPEEGLRLIPVTYDELPGWSDDTVAETLIALERSCGRITRHADDRDIGSQAIDTTVADWRAACTTILGLGETDDQTLRGVLETHFRPFRAEDQGAEANEDPTVGLFTGYFEAELTGDREQSDAYATPLYARPDDLITVDLGSFNPDLAGQGIVGQVSDGRLVPYLERGDIDAGALGAQDLELLWIDDPVDVFLLHVQGSGRVVLPDGEVVRVGFAAHNGHGYRSIGRRLIDLGEIEAHAASWGGIRGWIEDNPDRAAELFAFNPRFIFFRVLTGDGPIGAEGVALTPERSLAVDTAYVPLGTPVWLESVWPGDTSLEDGTSLNRLMVAQDKGGAIKGVVRGDFFWGYGDAALAEAGRMRSPGRYYLLLPNPLADRLEATG